MGFGERARQEAERYGTDPWVFVRELLQNARDAAARRVFLTAERRGGLDVVTCRDDGCGMSLEHARRFLFTLYASSKGRRSEAAGRFGVGFWSVLRFAPGTITVRSRPADGDGWEVVLDAGLEALEPASCVMFEGTEVILERTARGNHPLPMVLEAALRDARYLRPPGDGAPPLEVSVNGRRITEELTLPAPSLSFRRPGLRGAVALGAEARVDVLAHGLRVRSAPSLDELLLGEKVSPASVELAEGLLPRVVLDSDRLEVLLARGDVGDSPTLRRAVAAGHRALRRLVRSELDRSAPLSGPRRWLERAMEMRPPSRAVAMLGAALCGAVLGVGIAVLVAARSTPPRLHPVGGATMPAPETRPVAGVDHPLLYRDLAAAYGGPSVDVMDDRRGVALSYRPVTASPWLAALRLSGGEEGRGSDDVLVGPYEGAACHEGCVEVELRIDAAPGPLRLPLATGHVLDPASVRLDGVSQPLHVSVTGEPVLVLGTHHRGVLRYRTGPELRPAVAVATSWPPLPAGLAADAARLRGLPAAARVAAAVRLVASRIRYDRSREVAESHRRAIAAGAGALERALVVGAGDCDVQNFVLAALLDATGLPSRLAVGFVGRGGRAMGGVHAWVEVLHDGRWWVADASLAAPGTSSLGTTTPRALSAAPLGDVAGSGSRQAASGRPERRWMVPVGGAVAAVLVWLGVAAWRRTGTPGPPTISSGDGDLAPLLRAALLRPRAWRGVEAVYGRPLVPVVNGGPISLRRALALARRGRLYRATEVSDLVRRTSARSAAVVDAALPEGLVVADLLGAVDLDPWRGVLERSSQDEVMSRMEQALREVGLRVRLCVAPGAPAALAVIDGGPFGFGRGSSLVAVDVGSRLWKVVSGAALERPEWAVLLLGDEIVERAGAPRGREAHLRGELARRTLRGAEA